MIQLNQIDVFYGKSQALHGVVSLSVQTSEIVALIGANGAGKTTVLKAISGLIPWSGGEIFFKEKSLGVTPEEIAQQGISHVPERGGIFGKMTVMENLELGTVAQREKNDLKKIFERVFHLFPILEERKDQFGGQLSGGERQMLAIGRAMMSNPQLYLLDEPTLGLSPIVINQLNDIIKEISDQGGTILLVEQNALMALELAKRGYVLEIGRISREGPSQELLEDEQVKKAYLGL